MNQWTVLIYANGNNELEPEVYKRFVELEKENFKDKINILVQIGRGNRDLINILRQQVNLKDTIKQWEGVRRYEIRESKFNLIQDLGSINMASPENFAEFVIWGIKKYPLSKIMVIISGHGAGFIGLMTDYTQEKPYMMDIFGLTNSLYNIKANTGRSIDCLVLDACFMNMVEVWNEIALISNKPVKYLFAPSKNLKLEGLSYSLIVKSIVSKFTIRRSLKETIKIYNANFKKDGQLLLVDLNKKYFNLLYKEIDHISKILSEKNIDLRPLLYKWCLFKPIDPLISLLDLKCLLEKYNINNKLMSILNNIIICPELTDIHYRINEGPSLYLPLNLTQYLELRYYYDSLLFIQENNWSKIVGGPGNFVPRKNIKKNYFELVPPIIIPLYYVVATILDQNPEISDKEAWEIVRTVWEE
ncbi:MAG: hypothetical protein GX214_02055 [Clostridiales bacterium]|nr:hypothetical protein [Clostridiales bacterium]